MAGYSRSFSILSTAFLICCAAWVTPQHYVGVYRGLFPLPAQAALSFMILGALAYWMIATGIGAVRRRRFPWRPLAVVVGAFAAAELGWRLIIEPMPGGDFKAAWLAMLFAQPLVAMLGVAVLAIGWKMGVQRKAGYRQPSSR